MFLRRLSSRLGRELTLHRCLLCVCVSFCTTYWEIIRRHPCHDWSQECKGLLEWRLSAPFFLLVAGTDSVQRGALIAPAHKHSDCNPPLLASAARFPTCPSVVFKVQMRIIIARMYARTHARTPTHTLTAVWDPFHTQFAAAALRR